MNALRKYRETQALSQSDMAIKLDVSQAAYCRYENGSRVPRPKILRRIIEMTGGVVDANHFFELVHAVPPIGAPHD